MLNEQQKEELDKRYNEYLHGVDKNYTWEETVAMAEQALADKVAANSQSNLQSSDNKNLSC